MKRLWLWIAALFCLLEGIGAGLFYLNHRERERTYLDNYTQVSETAYRSALNMHALAMDTLYTETVDRPEVLRVFAAGGAATGSEQARWRGRLLAMLAPSYAAMQRRDVRQLHFHLPDGRSFLRFHQPEKYGDPLFEARPSVRIANSERRVVRGFETGKVVAGFRYVYPLRLDGRHLGSVETSVTFAAIRKAMAELASDHEFAFVVLRRAVAPKLFSGQEQLYEPAAIHPDFLVEDPQGKLPNSAPPPSLAVRAMDARLHEDEGVRAAMAAGATTTVKTQANGLTYAVTLVAVRDVEDRLAGYLLAYTPAPALDAMLRELAFSLLAYTLLLALGVILVVRLEEARAAAEAASIAKSRFLATMSHEIRTPMNGILGMAQLLAQPGLSEAEREDYARTIIDSGQTLQALLNDILDLSKVEAGKIELVAAAVDPERLVQEIRALFAEAAGRKGLRLEAVWRGPAGQRYRGDPVRLRQMLSNLVSNAVKFSLQGEIRIEAGEEGGRDPAHLYFSVADTGLGIPADKQSALFQPFSQVDNSTTRQHGGTGLGLSIVRSLARLMGGEAGVVSEAGKGSRFWFRIPAARIAAAAAMSGKEAPEMSGDLAQQILAEVPAGAPATICGRSARVLVVEDNATNRKVIDAMLRRLGCSVDLAVDGEGGVAAVTDGEAPDLVLMDVQMPVLDGYAATERIRRWESEHGRPRLPIVALTADAYETDRQHALAVGMDDFMAKPIDLGTLAGLLARWLGRERTSPAGAAAGPAPSAEATLFDGELLLNQVGGMPDIARLLVESALGEIPDAFAELAAALAAGGRQDAQRIAHTMKSLLAQVGGMRLAKRLGELDRRLRQGEAVAAGEVDVLRGEYAALAEALLGWLRRSG